MHSLNVLSSLPQAHTWSLPFFSIVPQNPRNSIIQFRPRKIHAHTSSRAFREGEQVAIKMGIVQPAVYIKKILAKDRWWGLDGGGGLSLLLVSVG